MASVRDVRQLLCGAGEVALLDVRDTQAFAAGHIPVSRPLPLAVLEREAGRRLPRVSVRTVVCDLDGKAAGEADRASRALARLGHGDVDVLEGGVRAWQAAGLPLAEGHATLARAFGERARRHYATPSITPAQLHDRLAAARPTSIIDVRQPPEFAFASIPGAANLPGLDVLGLQLDAADPDHLWVVTCFSRTRGVVATTSLQRLGGVERVAWLEDGVMAWFVEGLGVAQAAASAPVPPEHSDARKAAVAARIIGRHRLPVITPAMLDAWRDDGTRSLYVFDVRQQGAGRAGDGIRHVPGAQLLMHFDQHVPVRGARIVLVDDGHLLAAAAAAFWLAQLGEADVHILEGQPGTDAARAGDAAPDPPPPADTAPAGVWGPVMRMQPAQRAELYPRFLDWERHVAARTAGDPTLRFRFFP